MSLKLHGKEKRHKENEEGDVKRKRNERENDEEMKFGTNKIRRDEVWGRNAKGRNIAKYNQGKTKSMKQKQRDEGRRRKMQRDEV